MTWPQLPFEVIEIVLSLLDLESVKTLRLVNRSFSIRCIGSRFLRSIQQPTTDLTSENVASVKALVSNATICLQIHTLTIVGVYFASKEAHAKLNSQFCERGFEWPTDDLAKDASWLKKQTEAQNEVSASHVIQELTTILKTVGKWRCLKLDIAIQLGPKLRISAKRGMWPEIWTKASKVYEIAMASLRRSRILVSELDIYSRTPRCGIFAGDHSPPLALAHQSEMVVSMQHLNILKIGICTEMDYINWRDVFRFEKGRKLHDHSFGSIREIPFAEQNQTPSFRKSGIVSLLESTPNLRHLELRLYHFQDYLDIQKYNVFADVIEDHSFPQLESFSLSGFPVTQESLLRFLSMQPNLKRLCLQHIYLDQGTWLPIFKYINDEMSLESAHFASLKWWKNDEEETDEEEEGYLSRVLSVVHLHTTWESEPPITGPSTRYPPDGGDYFYSTPSEPLLHRRTFQQDDLRRGLDFHSAPEGDLASGREAAWSYHGADIYGPPRSQHFCPRQRPTRKFAT